MPRHLLLAAILWCAAVPAVGQNAPARPPTDPALESRVMAIAEELRCLVCQNETLAGSQAALAVDLRAQIRSQLREGRTPQQILDFMVARYGKFVLYRPPWGATTWLLWAGPFALLALGGWMVRSRLRATPATPVPDLTPQERALARRMLAQDTQTP